MPDMQARSPLTSERIVGTDFEMCELPRVAKARVQALRSRGVNTPCSDPHHLPTSPNTAVGDDPFVLWKAPDDWLAYSQTLSGTQLCDILGGIPASAPLIVTDVSSASVVIQLSGARVFEVLMRDCTLDLEGGALSPGNCVQTAFAQVNVVLHRPRNGKTWRLFVERSVAPHVWAWLSNGIDISPTPDNV
jgi:heterotetrameric sarcosine oxidase gamma subunit